MYESWWAVNQRPSAAARQVMLTAESSSPTAADVDVDADILWPTRPLTVSLKTNTKRRKAPNIEHRHHPLRRRRAAF